MMSLPVDTYIHHQVRDKIILISTSWDEYSILTIEVNVSSTDFIRKMFVWYFTSMLYLFLSCCHRSFC